MGKGRNWCKMEEKRVGKVREKGGKRKRKGWVRKEKRVGKGRETGG